MWSTASPPGLAASHRLGVPLTHRDHAQGVVLVTGHAQTGATAGATDWRALAATAHEARLTLVIYMGVSGAQRLQDELLTGLPAATPVAVVQDASLPTQRHARYHARLAWLAPPYRREHTRQPGRHHRGRGGAMRPWRLPEALPSWTERRPGPIAQTRPPARAAERVSRRCTAYTAAHEFSFDVVVIGAGAAGLFCAGVAGQPACKVLLVDHSDEGGREDPHLGRRPLPTSPTATSSASHRHFLGANPHFCRSALSRYTPADFIALLQRHGIAFHEKHKGQLFCDRSAEDLIQMLLAECGAGGVTRWQALQREIHTAFCASGPHDGTWIAMKLIPTRGVSTARCGGRSPRAACRSPRLAPRTLATASPGSSDCRGRPPGPAPGAADL
jgi:hypothetical protein